MKKAGLLWVAAAMGAAVAMTGVAQAAPSGVSGQLGTSADALNVVQDAQFIFGGRNYCFYLDGWHGPGWYWCGYAYRRGFGWGGPRGWHGWHHERRMEHRMERRMDRREFRRERHEHRRH